jgi:hypothetical protein
MDDIATSPVSYVFDLLLINLNNNTISDSDFRAMAREALYMAVTSDSTLGQIRPDYKEVWCGTTQ